MKKKRSFYEALMERMSAAKSEGYYYEASWYCYAMIEDRLLSLLRSSGGDKDKKGKEIRMIGPKLKILEGRAADNSRLKSCFPKDRIEAWKNERNELMHAMASGELDLEELDKRSFLLIETGETLVRELAAGAMRLKSAVGKKTPNKAS